MLKHKKTKKSIKGIPLARVCVRKFNFHFLLATHVVIRAEESKARKALKFCEKQNVSNGDLNFYAEFFTKLKKSNRQRHGLAAPRAGDRSCVTGSIRGWSRSQLTYITGGC